MKMSRCFLSPLVFSLVVFGLSLQAGPVAAAGRSGKGQDTVTKVVEINKQALAQLQAGKHEAARDALWGAVALLTDANMGDHEIAARTHVHLAAVYMTGFNDRNKAIRQLVMALKINPNIKITPQVETAALDEAFDAARSQASLPPAARSAAASAGKTPAGPAASGPAPAVEDRTASAAPASASPVGATGGGRRGMRGARKVADEEEPPPPAKVPEPFYCPLPSEVPPKEDILVRCVTQKQPRRSSATLFYRESGAEDFTPLPMTRSPKGWLTATVAAAAVTGNAFQFYLEAKVPGSKESLTIGSADSPNLMPIVDGAAPMNNSALVLLLQGKDTSARAEPMVEDKAPLEEINRQYQIDEDLRKYHRRLPGSVFLALGGGTGVTYHGPVNLDSHDYDPNDPKKTPLHVGSGYSLASILQVVPEFGYQFTDKLAFSLQPRIQYRPLESSGWNPRSGVSYPPNWAFAFFLRAQYAFFTGGNFQAFGSGILGGGQRTFLGYVAQKCNGTDVTIVCPPGTTHSDTISGGPVAAGVGVGMMYHLSRWLALWVEARGMSSVAPIILLGEFNAGFAIAHKFEKAGPPPPKEEGGWEKPPEQAEAPPADAPPSE
ncbi:MAG: tetratricopeptide repeat protein [Polyangia bacterium]|jgi:hypothetical protein